MELRGHEHTLEVVAFAPVSSYAAIRELGGLPVNSNPFILRIRLTSLG